MAHISPEELSIYELNKSTNNAAESYHSKLKSIVKTCHPRIWTFMSILNEVIADMDNDIGRLRQGREITRPRRKKYVTNEDLRLECKRKLQDLVVVKDVPRYTIFCVPHCVGVVAHGWFTETSIGYSLQIFQRFRKQLVRLKYILKYFLTVLFHPK